MIYIPCGRKGCLGDFDISCFCTHDRSLFGFLEAVDPFNLVWDL